MMHKYIFGNLLVFSEFKSFFKYNVLDVGIDSSYLLIY